MIRRYLLTLLFAMAVVGLYHFIEINLFSFDLLKRVKNALFELRDDPHSDETTMLFNIGSLQPGELQGKIDSLLIGQPKKIGINLCHYAKFPQNLVNKFRSDNRVVFVNCKDSGHGSLSQIIEDSNIVTHFKTDKHDYFELLLTNFKGRGNDIERINYGPKLDFIFKRELSTSYHWFDPYVLEGKTILLGYIGDYLTDSIYYYYKDCRITPLNKYYGQSNMLPDTYDIEISANIIRTINQKEFINEVNPIIRIFVILAFSMLSVFMLTFIKTKWVIINLVIATITYILLTILSSLSMVLAFNKGYFLELDELTLVFVITIVFTVLANLSEKKEPSNNE